MRWKGWAALVLVGVTACGSAEEIIEDPSPDAGVEPDRSDEVYDPDHVLEVAITMDEDDWDALRTKDRSLVDVLLGDCTAQPFEKIFDYYQATVTVDGEALEYDSGVRKKGFIGSLSDTKPSLKIKFSEYDPFQRYKSVERLTLNNQRQDPSYVNACMAYRVFRDAGIPAPRCNFAHVTVNGQDLGVYANVESYKKDFLRSQFGSAEGNLYEGTLSDFREEWRGTIEKKNNETENDFSDIDAMVAAIEGSSDAAFLDEVSQLVDVDAYIRFWATEILIAHWDGYASNRNNFYFYNDPATGKFQFLPWGADAVMRGPDAEAVVANGHLARRLYLNPQTQQQYLGELEDLLANVWDEDMLHDDVADTDGLAEFDDSLAGIRTFIDGRRGILETALSGSPPTWAQPVSGPPCMEPLGDLNATFSTTWGTLGSPDPFASGTGTLELTLDGTPFNFTLIGAVAGPNQNNPGEAIIGIIGALPDGTAGIALFTAPMQSLTSGASFEIDWRESFGILQRFVGAGQPAELLGYFAGGTLAFDQAGTFAGAPVSGRVEATQVVSPPFAAQVLPGGALPRLDARSLVLDLR